MSETTILIGIAVLVGVGIKKLKNHLEEKIDSISIKSDKAEVPELVAAPSIQVEVKDTNANILIAHNSKEIVGTLEHNLIKIGYQIQFKNEHNSSSFNQVILVVTPDAIESGWVRKEYEAMLNRQQNEPNFSFIPVILADTLTNSPFLPDIDVINFTTTEYPQAFHHLTSYFGGKLFVPDKLELPSSMNAPETIVTDETHNFIETVFSYFVQNSPPPLMLLAQMDRSQTPLIEALFTHAKIHYQPDRCFHIMLPYGTETYATDYFPVLAQQCGLDESINNGLEFEQALKYQVVSHSKPLLLVVSRFEHAAAFIRQQLAGILRSLYENHANQLHIILCGSAKLFELKYSPNSLLDIAKVYQWPELGRADVYAARDNYWQNMALDDESVDQLLAFSGGHPTLLQECLRLYQLDETRDWQDYSVTLCSEASLNSCFTPITQNSQETQQLCQWLTQEEIAPSSSMFSYNHKRNELVRNLYWQNLLVERQIDGRKRLCWRSEALKSIVKTSLQF